MPNGKCKAAAQPLNVHVETFCGVHNNRKFRAMCDLRKSDTVFHVVQLHNLNTYPLVVTCVGSIKSDPPKVKFVSSNPSDSETQWTSRVKLGNNLTHDLTHVQLIPLQNALGNEEIHTTVTIRHKLLFKTGRQEQLMFSINIS